MKQPSRLQQTCCKRLEIPDTVILTLGLADISIPSSSQGLRRVASLLAPPWDDEDMVAWLITSVRDDGCRPAGSHHQSKNQIPCVEETRSRC
ncbi:hypothetical protein MES4922_230171 [Mesorhizobium ventifaucium]|uniref:Uncharacterized protein n=1 Tax=Mesorhizobium ventifaucium TaxID=666020 RepID=A0ABN8JQ26_9HYPH|nr:hypothetical protein MES4922_230171 [Mesorhizobium ventifaucium]